MADEKQPENGFITWGDDSSKQKAFSDAAASVELYEGIQRTSAYSYRSF